MGCSRLAHHAVHWRATTDDELEAHAELVKGLKKPIWTE